MKTLYIKTLCLHISNFGDPISIDLVHQFWMSAHPLVICMIILFNKYNLYHIKSKSVRYLNFQGESGFQLLTRILDPR